MKQNVRAATEADVPAMVAMSERERAQRENFEPEFFRKAARGAEAQAAFFAAQLTWKSVIALVNEANGAIDGFAIASLITAPPVYEPGGETALIDDFTVDRSELWESVGRDLFEAIVEEAKRRGAVGVVSICAHKDEVKRNFLRRLGLRVVSEWHFLRL